MSGHMHNQRDPHRLLVQRVTVALEAMFAKLFTVIGDDRDNGLVKSIQLVHTFEQTRHMLIDPTNLAVVQVDVGL